MGQRAEPVEFERRRLALFARYGLEGEGRRVADREGRDTYLIVRGESSCPTVLVHGGLSEASEWCLLAGRLPGHVILPDRPGCGLSYPIDYRGSDFRRAAVEWLYDLADAIGAGQIDLVGHSMGGYFAMAFAIAHPDRVSRLVLAGAPPGLGREVPLFLRLWGNPIVGPLVGRIKITDPEKLRARVFAQLVAHPETLPLDFLETSLAADALPGAARASYTGLRSVSTLRGFRRHLILRDDMTRVSVPTLIAWGETESFVPESRGRDLATSMPDARFQIVPDAGHVLQLDQPEAVAALIADFLARDSGRLAPRDGAVAPFSLAPGQRAS